MTSLERSRNILPRPILANGFPGNVVNAPSQSDADQLEAAADQAIAACGGDAREAVKARRIVANQSLETDLEKLRAGVDGLCAPEAV